MASNKLRISLDKITPLAAPAMAPWRIPFFVRKPAKAPTMTPNIAPTESNDTQIPVILADMVESVEMHASLELTEETFDIKEERGAGGGQVKTFMQLTCSCNKPKPHHPQKIPENNLPSLDRLLPTNPMGLCYSRSRSHDIPISSSSDEDYYQPAPPKRPTQARYNPPPPPPPPPPPAAVSAATSKPALTSKTFVKSQTTVTSSSNIGPILGKPYIDITTIYDLDKELGRGQFGITYLCTEKATGRKYACKSISRRKIVSEEDIEDVRREILILQHLTGEPNIVEFRGAYEDKQNLHLVMELCSGGELFDRILAKGTYSEKEAATIFRQIVNVVHASLSPTREEAQRPEPQTFHGKHAAKLSTNQLMVLSNNNAAARKVYKDIVGTPYYFAPELLRRSYGKEVDVWSAGIILYILLSGMPPFWAETEKGVFDAILEGNLDLHSDPWPNISSSAKDLIKKMIRTDPKRRITAAQALEHPWMKVDGEASDKPIDSAVLIRMKQFRAMNKLKKLALKVIAENLSEEEIKGSKQMFSNMDTDRSGTITYDELKSGLWRLGSKLTEVEIKQLMDAADVDKSGTLDYVEFMTATMHRHRLDKEENLYKAFQYFDTANRGFITREELRQAMAQYGMGDDATIDEVIEDVDTDKDGNIHYEDFAAMMRKGTHDYETLDTLNASVGITAKTAIKRARLCKLGFHLPMAPNQEWERHSKVLNPTLGTN
ncbi:unnamed protein product [Dovyalis caffra]|uniref:non-specific serine/threonine protein kinase n=1 Tax=Dovyalis caffra TaxID=77055 RepID=A0AAV1S4A7_9ROSI|nr:unnamed protein product [Dovyalis caffra]